MTGCGTCTDANTCTDCNAGYCMDSSNTCHGKLVKTTLSCLDVQVYVASNVSILDHYISLLIYYGTWTVKTCMLAKSSSNLD